MQRALILDCINKVGEDVKICGWVYTIRHHGKILFLDLLDRSGIIQVVVSGKDIPGLHPQDIVCTTGQVNKRPEHLVNKNIPTGEIEISAKDVEVLSKATELPFDMGGLELNVNLPTLLDYRPLTLRHPKIKAIFKVQETIISSFRQTLKGLDFTEFQAPAIVPVATEGGAEVFPIDYYDHKAYLAQSPQLYKQMMVGVFERVFTIGKAYRAEPSTTTRHLSEYVTLDVELGFIENWEEILDTAEHVIISIFKAVEQENKPELELYKATIPEVSPKLPRIKLREAQEVIFKRTGRDVRNEPDLSPEDEKEICQWSKEEYGSELIIVTHYPTSKRPFYTFPDPKNPEYTLSFDLLGRGLEWFTGGQRINDHGQLVSNIRARGLKEKDFALYLQAFKYGMPPEGGFAIGAERVTMHILGLANVREASLFPRDMERVDIRLSEAK